MLILKVLFAILLALLALIVVLLFAEVGIRFKINKDTKVYIKIGFIYLNTNLFVKKKKSKVKVQSLSKSLENKNQEDKPLVAEKGVQEKHIFAKEQKTLPKQDKPNCKIKQKNQSFISKIKKLVQKIKDADIAGKLAVIKQVASEFLGKCSKHGKIRIKKACISVSCDDAQNTALLYSAVHTALSSLIEKCREFRFFRINENKVYASPNFLSGKTTFDLDFIISIRTFKAIICIVPLIKTTVKTKNNSRKDV